MQQSSTTLIMIVAAVSLTIGYIAGWLITTFTRPKDNDESEGGEGQEVKDRLAPAVRPEVPPGNPTGAYRPLVRLWREDKGRLLVEYDGKSLVTASTLLPEQRKRLEVVLRELAVWLGLLPASAGTAPEAAPAEPPPAPVAPSVPLVARAAAADPLMPPAAETLKPPKLVEGVTVGLANVLNPPVVKREAPKTIVGQINDVVQELLAESSLAGQKIYLTEDLRRGVIVWAQGQSYEGIDSVPAGEVKDLLKRSVAEWERRTEELARRP
ncbi:MAG: hypothetical protein JW987_09480 [Anaerolineaceae bacterium]|nr:hypothetical protein [Anaerolineaceae bacterium]